MREIYLDYNSTSPIAPEVRAVMEPFLGERFGNPSSLHRAGQSARFAIEEAREALAGAVGAAPGDVIFTSGGTEANNLAVKGCARARARRGKKHLITSSVEHASVLDAVYELVKQEGFSVTLVPVSRRGAVDPAEVKRALRPDTALVSIMHANNEIGTVQPVEEIGRIAEEAQVPFHVDAIQSFGKIPFSMSALRCRVATFSSHKIYGPKGAGALCLRQGTEIAALFHGGHQEKNVRPGTENTAAIAGFGAAIRFIEAQREEDSARLARLKTLLYEGLRESCAPAELNGDPAACLPGTLNVRFPGLDAISFAMALDLAGVRVSTGAACTAGSTEPSHVLLALGLTEAEAKSSVRISMGHFTSEEDVRETIAAASRAAGRLRKAGTAL